MKPKIALLDSGVNERHPHIIENGEIVHGPIIDGTGRLIDDPEPGDLIGHGTCAAAAILDLVPGSSILSMRIFREESHCSFPDLITALQYAIESGVNWVNLSLGTTRPSESPALEKLLERGKELGVGVVAPAQVGGLPCFPGALEGCHGVLADDSLPRQKPERRSHGDGKMWFASPRPRDLPGLPAAANLSGVSLAAANLTGYRAGGN